MIPQDIFRLPENVKEAIQLQKKLAASISRRNELKQIQYIAGVDTSINKTTDTGCAAVVVLKYPEMKFIESQTFSGKIPFPYISGLLSFREIPLALQAFNKLTIKPDLLLIDGQGIAHPRRIGFASHFGLVVDLPTIGCAKSRLCGEHEMPAITKGTYADLIDKKEIIGAVLRTRDNTKPLFISIGHKIDLASAIHWTLECCRGYRLPEPCRLAHLTSKGIY
jgi:deoxyribonuclease V